MMRFVALVALLAFPGSLAKCTCKDKSWVPGQWCRSGGDYNATTVASLDACLGFCQGKGMVWSSCCMYQEDEKKDNCQWMDRSATYDGAPYKGGACFGTPSDPIQCDKPPPPPPPSPDATCASHPKCKGLAGDCCPTATGVTLECCKSNITMPPPPPPGATCASHPKCTGLAGDCCPTSAGVTLDCCKDDSIEAEFEQALEEAKFVQAIKDVQQKLATEIEVVFSTTMGPTIFTVTQAAIDGRVSIVPQMNKNAKLTFSKDSVMSMMTSSGITVKETGKSNPKGAYCEYLTAGPITGAPECNVFFSLISIHCTCVNFPRSAVVV